MAESAGDALSADALVTRKTTKTRVDDQGIGFGFTFYLIAMRATEDFRV